MVKERGYPGAADHFRSIVVRYRPSPPAEAYLRLRTLPGEQAQVDWAHFGKLAVDGGFRKLYVFLMVFSTQVQRRRRPQSAARALARRRQRSTQYKKRARQDRSTDRLHHASPASEPFLCKVAERGGNLGSTDANLLKHLDTFGAEALDEALCAAVANDTPHLHAVRQLLDQYRHKRNVPPALSVPVSDDPRVTRQRVFTRKLSTNDKPASGSDNDDE